MKWVHQKDLSPCCNAPMLTFSSGGGEQVSGPYVKCHNCRIDHQIDYKTGYLINADGQHITAKERMPMAKVDTAFLKFIKEKKKEGFVYHHQIGCPMHQNPTPINECSCDCYELALFKAGYKAGMIQGLKEGA